MKFTCLLSKPPGGLFAIGRQRNQVAFQNEEAGKFFFRKGNIFLNYFTDY